MIGLHMMILLNTINDINNNSYQSSLYDKLGNGKYRNNSTATAMTTAAVVDYNRQHRRKTKKARLQRRSCQYKEQPTETEATSGWHFIR